MIRWLALRDTLRIAIPRANSTSITAELRDVDHVLNIFTPSKRKLYSEIKEYTKNKKPIWAFWAGHYKSDIEKRTHGTIEDARKKERLRGKVGCAVCARKVTQWSRRRTSGAFVTLFGSYSKDILSILIPSISD